MPPRQANRRWAGRSRCGGSRAAAADADVAVVTISPGPGLVPRLREALDRAQNAKRLVLSELPYPLAGEGPGPPAPASRAERAMRAFEASGEGYGITVLATPVTDTCKEVVDGVVRRTVPRDTLVDARGPWMFTRAELVQALDFVGPNAAISNLVDLCRVARLRVRVLIQQ